MRWASAITHASDIETAMTDTEGQIRDQLGELEPHLVVVFASPHYAGSYDELAPLLADMYSDALVVGCSAGGLIGGGQEIENQAALSVTAAVLPDVHLVPFHMTNMDIPGDLGDLTQWEELTGVSTDLAPNFLLLADPMTFDVQRWILGLDLAYPDAPKFGGVASGPLQETTSLFLGRRRVTSGAVGVAIYGDIEVDTVVAQGCKPIGSPLFVTRCKANVLYELDGSEPGTVLERIHRELDDDDRELFRHSIFLGLVMNDMQQAYGPGDFLIRTILGIEADSRGLVVGAYLQPNQVVQFHLRDQHAAHDDLVALMGNYRHEQGEREAPAGALLFSCLGRGSALYGRPNHDSDVVRTYLGPLPLGGFFCNGEIGPVHGRTYLHGYTSSIALFRPRRAPVH